MHSHPQQPGAWGLPALTVPLHHAPIPEEQRPNAHSEHAVACGERGHQLSACPWDRPPLVVSLFFCPCRMSIGPFPWTPSSKTADHSFFHSPALQAGTPGCLSFSLTREAAAAATPLPPMPQFLENTLWAGTAGEPKGLAVYGWVALAPQSSRRLFASQVAGASMGKDGIYSWVELHGGSWLPGPLL